MLFEHFPFLKTQHGRKQMYKKVLGALIGAGAGDAMGAATEARTTEQILEYFGHEVMDFETPPLDTFAAGNIPGQLTDDFSSAYFISKHIIEHFGFYVIIILLIEKFRFDFCKLLDT